MTCHLKSRESLGNSIECFVEPMRKLWKNSGKTVESIDERRMSTSKKY